MIFCKVFFVSAKSYNIRSAATLEREGLRPFSSTNAANTVYLLIAQCAKEFFYLLCGEVHFLLQTFSTGRSLQLEYTMRQPHLKTTA